MPYKTQPFTVRVMYVVPVDAEPWEEAKCRATEWLEGMQWFFADEMDRHGYGPKTFEIARDEDGELVFHQILSPLFKKDFNGRFDSRKDNCTKVAHDYGLQKVNRSDIVVYIHESCSISDGELAGDGAKSTGGNSFLGSLHLKLAIKEWLADNSEFDNKCISWISSEPMKRKMLNNRGSKVGDVSGAAFGIMTHEIAHCFGLQDEKDNKKIQNVNLMRFGYRRMRGYFRPDLTNDRCIISEESAKILDRTDFFAVRTLKPKSLGFSRDTAK